MQPELAGRFHAVWPDLNHVPLLEMPPMSDYLLFIKPDPECVHTDFLTLADHERLKVWADCIGKYGTMTRTRLIQAYHRTSLPPALVGILDRDFRLDPDVFTDALRAWRRHDAEGARALLFKYGASGGFDEHNGADTAMLMQLERAAMRPIDPGAV